MNVMQNDKFFQPPRERNGARQEQFTGIQSLARQIDPNKRLRTQWKSGNSSYLKTPILQGTTSGRVRATSSSALPTSSRTHVSARSAMKSTTAISSSESSGIILAITTGRGEARTEVGMAAINIHCPYLVLCQISDAQTHVNALSKLYLFDPMEVLMPDTMCVSSASTSVLYRSITNKFPELQVTPISRIHFNDANGLERVKTLCAAEYSSVELFVKEKYYALAAAAALLKYVEYTQRIVYAPKSMKIEFQGSPNATIIDLESARSLELVQSQCGQRNVSLLGILDFCSTPMGRKLLRANILQPPCQEIVILERQSSIAELASNSSLRAVLQPLVRRLYGADRLVALSIAPVLNENTVQCAEQNLNYILLLKNLLDVVPELEAVLSTSESNIFRGILKNLRNDRFRLMRERILETIHPDAKSVGGYTSSNMQRCFALKAGVNDLLDVARQTYCELIDDMKSMVENLASKYSLTLSLGCNALLGYHVQAIFPRNWNADNFSPPDVFIEVRKNKRVYTMTTTALATLSQQCKIASEELHLMSNVLLCDLLQSVREHITCLFQLSADVAELDLIISLARVSSIQTYVRPTFGRKLKVLDSRHPVLETLGSSNPVPNNVDASVPWNFHVITGPNMSGKSTYLKQIVLLQIMAQIGCFVPAKKATFRITDLIYCKIAVRDDIECNASTFTLEMKESQHILRSVTPTSLVIFDELCKGTSVEEGASIAWAICERLLNTSAFVFIATHFTFLTKLANVYYNVTNHYFETINVRENEADSYQLTYTHRLKRGVTPINDYGIALAELSGLPKSVTEKAREYASERLIGEQVASIPHASEKKCYGIVAHMSELLETKKFDRKRVSNLLARIAKLEDEEGNEDIAEMPNDSDMGISMEEEDENRDTSNIMSATVCSRNSFDTICADQTTVYTNTSLKDMSLASWANSNASHYIEVANKGLGLQTDMSNFGNNSFKLNSPVERHVSFSCSSHSMYSFSPRSMVSRNPLNELERHLSITSILESDLIEQREPLNSNEGMSSPNNIPSLQLTDPISGKTVSPFLLTGEIPSPQLFNSPNKSGTMLYEYCFSDIDFELSGMSRASTFSNDELIDKNR